MVRLPLKGWKNICTIAFILLAANLVHAQTWPFELWHEGKIVLVQGDTLRGQVKYDLQQDLVQYAINNRKPEVYTARKIAFFEIFDETVHKYRQFYALPFNTVGGYKTPVFFELLEEGKMTLLTREALENKIYSSFYMGSYTRVVLVYKYFFLTEKGEIEEFTGTKNDLLDKMGKRSDDVEKFIKSNRLKFDDRYDFARIIAYYNSLAGS